MPSKVGGGLAQIPGTAGRFHGNPMSGNQTCKWPPISNVTLKELQWRNLPELIPTMHFFLWRLGRNGCWIGKIGDQSSDPQNSIEQAIKLQNNGDILMFNIWKISYFFITSHSFLTGSLELTNFSSQLQGLHSSVGYRGSYRYREVTGSNPVEVLASIRSYCLNCVHNCEDHSLRYLI